MSLMNLNASLGAAPPRSRPHEGTDFPLLPFAADGACVLEGDGRHGKSDLSRIATILRACRALGAREAGGTWR